MSQKLRVRSIKLETFGHETEDEEKVIKALLNIVPERLRNIINLTMLTVKGHFNNKIKVFKVKVENLLANETLDYIIKSLSRDDKEFIRNTIDMRFNRGVLYIRFDKQKAYLGSLELTDYSDDIIKTEIVFNPRVKDKESIVQWANKIFNTNNRVK
ncbi:MAG: RNA-binding domain-containing protein [Candidatus Methanomethylicia archaeon]